MVKVAYGVPGRYLPSVTTPEPTSPPRPPRWSTDRLLAFSAVFLSLAALVVAIFQTAILREQQRASAWPHLQFGTSMLEGDYAVTLGNNGVGPAIIREVDIDFDGRAYASLKAVFDAEIRGASAIDTLDYGHYYWDVEAGDVLAIQQTVDLFRVVNSPAAAEIVAEAFADPRFRFAVRYADVYGNEWLLRDGEVTEL